jgi:hypothetical protein
MLVRVHRPTLLGAVLIKARAILVHSDPDASARTSCSSSRSSRIPHKQPAT